MKRGAMYFFAALFLAASIPAAHGEEEGVDTKALFESKCSLCHTIERPKSKKKSREEWQATVLRMKNVNGCPVTDGEAALIIDYLADHYGK